MRAASPTLVLLVVLLLPAVAGGEGLLYLNLSRDDIDSTATRNGTLWLKLSPRATSELKQITHDNQGKSLRVAYESIQILELRIHASVESGVIQVTNPPPSLLRAFDVQHQ